jgi:HEAT repeat protein
MRKHLLICLLVAVTVSAKPSARGNDQPIRKSSKAAADPAALVEALKDKDPGVRLQAAQLLVQKGEDNAALSALVELLKAPEEAIRLQAAQLLKQIRPGRLKAAIPALVALLKDMDAKVRSQAAQILGSMQSAARTAAPALVAMLKVELVCHKETRHLGLIPLRPNIICETAGYLCHCFADFFQGHGVVRFLCIGL